jgi:hypothetical protein
MDEHCADADRTGLTSDIGARQVWSPFRYGQTMTTPDRIVVGRNRRLVTYGDDTANTTDDLSQLPWIWTFALGTVILRRLSPWRRIDIAALGSSENVWLWATQPSWDCCKGPEPSTTQP